MEKIVIDCADAEEFMEMLRETMENLKRPEWNYPAEAVESIMEAFSDLCGGSLETDG